MRGSAQDGELEVSTWDRDAGWDEMLETAKRLGILERYRVLDAQGARARIDSPVFRGALETTFEPRCTPRAWREVCAASCSAAASGSSSTRRSRGSTRAGVRSREPHTARCAPARRSSRSTRGRSTGAEFRRGLTVRGTYIVLTAPAPERLDELGWTDGTGLWDTRASVHYVRTTPDGRIAFGIGGMQPDFARTIDRRYVRRALDPGRDPGPASDVPVVRRRAGRGRVGRAHRRRGAARAGVHDRRARHGTRGPRVHGQRRRPVAPGRADAHRALGRDGEVLALPLVDLEPKRPRRSRSAASARSWRTERSSGETTPSTTAGV